jgi:hypothetical protein
LFELNVVCSVECDGRQWARGPSNCVAALAYRLRRALSSNHVLRPALPLSWLHCALRGLSYRNGIKPESKASGSVSAVVGHVLQSDRQQTGMRVPRGTHCIAACHDAVETAGAVCLQALCYVSLPTFCGCFIIQLQTASIAIVIASEREEIGEGDPMYVSRNVVRVLFYVLRETGHDTE